MDLDALKDDILLGTLPNVTFDGWTERALNYGAESAGHPSAVVLRAFPRGVPDVIAHFSDWADRQMLAALEAEGEAFAQLRVRDKIARAVQARLEVLEPYQDAVRRALVLLALPQNAVLSAWLVYRTVDAMWRAAGDTATDHNFYSKRGLLAGVQGATLLYWLNDSSEGHAATWTFLDRRIGDVLTLGRAVGRVKPLGRLAEAPFRLAGGLRQRLAGLRDFAARATGRPDIRTATD